MGGGHDEREQTLVTYEFFKKTNEKRKYLFSNRTDSRYNLILQFFSNLRTAITSFAIRKLAA
ncbi:hypothetical protein EfmAA242_28780 [Enterococcus faecium]|nr:hypothetical protein EfmAA242_28780 [Enterococcus faecium]